MRNDHLIVKASGEENLARFASEYALQQRLEQIHRERPSLERYSIGHGGFRTTASGCYCATPPELSRSIYDGVNEWRGKFTDEFKQSFQEAFSVHTDSTGVCFDMGEAISGNPDCWQDVQIEPARIIRVGLNLSSQCSTTDQQRMWRGGAICAVCDLLQQRGHRFEIEVLYGGLYAAHSYEDLKRCEHLRMLLKPADQPLDLRRVSEWILSPNCTSHGIEIVSRLWPNCRCAYQIHLGLKLGILNGEYDVYVDRIEEPWTEEYTRQWIQRQLDRCKRSGDATASTSEFD
jgi:hypothetical protein